MCLWLVNEINKILVMLVCCHQQSPCTWHLLCFCEPVHSEPSLGGIERPPKHTLAPIWTWNVDVYGQRCLLIKSEPQRLLFEVGWPPYGHTTRMRECRSTSLEVRTRMASTKMARGPNVGSADLTMDLWAYQSASTPLQSSTTLVCHAHSPLWCTFPLFLFISL